MCSDIFVIVFMCICYFYDNIFVFIPASSVKYSNYLIIHSTKGTLIWCIHVASERIWIIFYDNEHKWKQLKISYFMLINHLVAFAINILCHYVNHSYSTFQYLSKTLISIFNVRSVYTRRDFAAVVNWDDSVLSVCHIECQPKSKQTTPEHHLWLFITIILNTDSQFHVIKLSLAISLSQLSIVCIFNDCFIRNGFVSTLHYL